VGKNCRTHQNPLDKPTATIACDPPIAKQKGKGHPRNKLKKGGVGPRKRKKSSSGILSMNYIKTTRGFEANSHEYKFNGPPRKSKSLDVE